MPRGVLPRVALLVVLSTALSGCFLWTTRSEGDDLMAGARERERRLRALETGIHDQQRQLAAAVEQAEAKVTELEQVLDRATKVVTRNSADVGLQVRALGEQIGQLEGQIAALRHTLAQRENEIASLRQNTDRRIKQVAQRAGIDMPIDPSEVPDGREAHYAAAYQAYQTSDYARARALFREFLTRYAEDAQADDALYWVGKSYLQERRPATALGEFRKVITDHPRGDAVDDTLLDMAEAFWQLHACTDARTALQALIRGHARSPLIGQARQKLRRVEQAPEGYCTG